MTALLARNHYIIAGDLNRRILKTAKKNASACKQNTEFVLLSVTNLPFRNKSVETLLLIDVLEHLEKPVEALKEAEQIAAKKILIDLPNYDFATSLYPNMLPEHFNESSHKQKTNVKTLENWLKDMKFFKKTVHGSCFPMPLPLVSLSYLFEVFFKSVHTKPKRFHFQISCELLL